MERSRSKRKYYYDQDYERNNNNNKPRYPGGGGGHHRRGGGMGGGGGGGGGGRFNKFQDSSNSVAVSYRILCHDVRAGGVIGKSGSIIKAIRQETGAWINVHQLIPGDEERVIEITDVQRRDADRRVPPFSPSQEALFMIHERIIESDPGFGYAGYIGGDDDDEFGRGGSRVATRLVVAKANVGCLLGKGGKIIEQMRIETKTQIRVLPRDQTLPQCVAMSEEVVQVVGHIEDVKRALVIISTRLRESQLRDRSHFQGRQHSPDRFFPDDDFVPYMNNGPRGPEGPPFSQQPPPALTNLRNDNYNSRSTGHGFESKGMTMGNHAQPFSVQDIVFRILCPSEKVERVMGEHDGIMELLRNDVGVDIRIMDAEPGADERIIMISSDEDPDDDLFPSQEALLHIQTRIVDLDPEKDNIITTRLLVPSSETEFLRRHDGSLSEINKLTGANIQILPREEHAMGAVGADELVQIVGEIRAARVALVELTSRLRDYLYHDVSFEKEFLPPANAVPDQAAGMFALETESPSRSPAGGYRAAPASTTSWPSKDAGVSGSKLADQRRDNAVPEEAATSNLNRMSAPLVTRSTLEVVIPDYAITKLIMGSKNKLAQISELSGASVVLVEDAPEQTQKIIKISGSPEQAERAQSLLQGFILSTQEDAP